VKKAVIYIRVSTTKQVIQGASLDTQQMMCQDWASRNNVLVEKIYHDDGVSAKTLDRPAMQEMLSYLRSNKGRIDYLVTYQTDRLSRNATDFFALRTLLSQLGIEYKNINSSIDETPNDQLIQNIEAVLAQHDNTMKSTRVKDNMKRHARSGFRMSIAPYGLRNTRDPLGNSTLAPVEGVADQIASILEAYATGTHTMSSLITMCENIGLKSAHGKTMQIQAISKMLRYPIYAGLEQSTHTDGELIPAHFKGIITPAVFHRNQELLRANKNTAAKYKKINPEFPLRRFLRCASCDKPLTGSSPRNGSGKYSPRYHCAHCHVPSIQTEEAHEQFLHLLASLSPDPDMERFLKEMIVRVWREETLTLNTKQKKLHRTLEQLTERKTKVIEMLVAGQISLDEKNELVAKIKSETDTAQKDLDSIGSLSNLKADSIDYALQFMSNAPKIWSSASVEHRIIYQRLVFPDGIQYDLSKNVFRTPKLSLLYTLASITKDPSMKDESLVVTLPGIEPGLPG
jgi:site-specific DNA recombinase